MLYGAHPACFTSLKRLSAGSFLNIGTCLAALETELWALEIL